MMLKSLNIFEGYGRYFRIYRRYVGRGLFILFALSLLAVAVDSLGIAMLLPLLKVSEIHQEALGGKTEILVDLLELLHVPITQTAVLVFIGFLYLGKSGIKFCEGFYRAYLQKNLHRALKAGLLRHYSRMEYIFYASRNTGHFINIINSQTNRFHQSFEFYVKFSAQLITTIGYLAFAFLLDWRFSLMAVFGGLGVLLLFRKLSDYSKRLSRKLSLENTLLNKFLVQMLQSLKYLSSTASAANIETNSIKSINKATSYQFKLHIVNAFTEAIKEPVAVLFLIVLMIVQITVFNQSIPAIAVTLLLFYRAMNTMVSIQGSWQQVMNFVGGLEMTIDEFEQVEAHREIPGKRKLGGFKKEIVFENVSFAYDQTTVLHGINLRISANSTVAFVGESGAGKSTLVDLITLLLKPSSGRIVIDDIPHPELNYPDWRRNIGFVTQETIVFDDTVANNISLWNCDFDHDEACRFRIREAATQACCRPFIDDLPDGYRTLVGDRGVKLSGGQRQRLFIARELFKKPRLLIMDEATSSLDTESERYIQKSIDDLKGRMTVVIIAHRLSTIRNADYIYVLDKGRIVEEGSFGELTRNMDSRFGKMVSMQNLT